jgi:solute carrier family 34 (sodium-dependent phosphate cotransporter)
MRELAALPRARLLRTAVTETPPIDSNQPSASVPRWPALNKAMSGLRSAFSRIRWRKIALFIISLLMFILAITLMKEGAYDLGPVVRDRFTVSNPVNSLGFGWLFAYVIMSGSPVAAAALTFLDSGVIDALSSFTMITGSRLGASLIVLLIGFIYVLRGRGRITSLEMGLLSLAVTGSTYIVAMFIGIYMLYAGWFSGFHPGSGALLNSVTDLILDPIVAVFLAALPRWSLFLVGLGIIMVSFNLFDKCLPQMSLKESQLGHMSRLVYRPWVMFLLGAGITLISMSVSVSLAILVPLSQRGFVRRENVIPYIMGANITTFIDTLFAALLLTDPAAFTVVLVSMVSVALVSIVILATFYRRFERAMLQFVAWTVQDNRYLGIFLVLILAVPIFLMLI